MRQIGIDLEQYVRDPYGSGIQRVLQNLARWWPNDLAEGTFVVPFADSFLLLNPREAADLLDIAFECEPESLGPSIRGRLEELAQEGPLVPLSGLLPLFHAWLLPEVSYLRPVLDRFRIFQESMPVAMIGFDALPMTNPTNYRFRPGSQASISEYFRLLATADAVICISEYARTMIRSRLRRDPVAETSVALPGGDHIPLQHRTSREVTGAYTFLRVGTLEARKRPEELIRAFRTARSEGANAELTFVGRASASEAGINEAVGRAVADGIGVRWFESLGDAALREVIARSDYFVSVGIEGFGIPVLEAIRLGTPVLYAGVQPAGEVMQGRGATSIGVDDHDSLTRMFREFSAPESVDVATAGVCGEEVPRWSDFARGVVEGIFESVR